MAKIDKILYIEEVVKRLRKEEFYVIKIMNNKQLKATFFHGRWRIRESKFIDFFINNCKLSFVHFENLATLFDIEHDVLEKAMKELNIPCIQVSGDTSRCRISKTDIAGLYTQLQRV